jgi:hypothetical protein
VNPDPSQPRAPEVSVIIAAIDGRPDVDSTISAVRSQARDRSLEILLVANPSHPCTIRGQTTGVTLLVSDRRRLVPELWGLGVARAQGAIVATTIAGCTPDGCWFDAMMVGHQSAHAAIGGPIEQHASGHLMDWAVYFVRYAAYMQPLRSGRVLQVPGDNGSYKKDALEHERGTIAAEGFWEYEINERLVARGHTLSMASDMAVWHTHSFGVRSFARQRWQHGRIFGRSKAGTISAPARVMRAALAPFSLATMVQRAARHVFTRRRHRMQFLRALPHVVLFYACWIAGETAGLFQAAE